MEWRDTDGVEGRQMEWKLGIDSGELNRKFLVFDEQMTTVRDQLSILENRAEQLAECWQGQAKQQWMKEFRGQLFQIYQQVAALQKQKLYLKKQALSLIQLEQSIENREVTF